MLTVRDTTVWLTSVGWLGFAPSHFQEEDVEVGQRSLSLSRPVDKNILSKKNCIKHQTYQTAPYSWLWKTDELHRTDWTHCREWVGAGQLVASGLGEGGAVSNWENQLGQISIAEWSWNYINRIQSVYIYIYYMTTIYKKCSIKYIM